MWTVISAKKPFFCFSQPDPKKKTKKGGKADDSDVAYNPLDSTLVHPESYHIAEKLIAIEKFELKDVGSAKFIDHFRRVDPKKFVDCFNDEASYERVPQILEAFRLKLASDIRDEKARPTFRRDILSVDNLNAGMVLSGEVAQSSLAV